MLRAFFFLASGVTVEVCYDGITVGQTFEVKKASERLRR